MEGSRPWTSGDEDLRPESAALRSLRRWVIFASVASVVATVIAIIALLDSPDETNVEAVVAPRVTEARRALDERVDARLDRFRRQISGLATKDELQGVERRVADLDEEASRATSTASRASRSARSASSDVDALERRVERLEERQRENGDGESGSP